MRHTLTQIVKNTDAKLSHVCNGKAYFRINLDGTLYQLELDSLDADWKDNYIQPEYRTITLMRWIRESIDNHTDAFIQLN